MQSFEIIGGKKLKGEITPQGAKNEALQIISAVLLTDQVVRISNIPDIVDVNKLIDLLQDMGVKVNRESKDTYTFQADQIDQEYLFVILEDFLIISKVDTNLFFKHFKYMEDNQINHISSAANPKP